MSSPVALLDALERVDSESAEFFSRYVLSQVAADAYVEVVKSYGPGIVRMLVESERRLRADAGGAYVEAVSKSADPASGAAAAARFETAVAEAQVLRDAVIDELVVLSKAEEEWQWKKDGRRERRSVGRDDKGRFTRSVSQTRESDITQWARPDDDKAPKNQRRLPKQMESKVTPGESGRGATFADEVEAKEAEKQKYQRYLYQLSAVEDLQRELKDVFGDSAESMLDLNLRLMNPETGDELSQQVGLNAPMDAYAWDPQGTQLAGIDYGPQERLGARDQNKVMGQLAAGQIDGAPLRMDPALLESLGAALSGKGTKYDDSKMSRFSQATRNWSDTVGRLPGAKAQAASDMLRGMSATADAAGSMREPMTRAAYRLRGTSKTPDKALTRSVQGEGVSVDEQAFLDGLAGVKRQLVAGESADQVKSRWAPKMRELQAGGERKVGNDGLVRMVPSAGLLEAQRQFEGEVRAAEARGKRGVAPDAKYFEGKELSPVAASAVARVTRGESGEAVLRSAQRDAAAKFFLDQMITRSGGERDSSKDKIRESGVSAENLSRLVESVAGGVGRGFPSEGVMIDAEGRVTSQSVGIAEDHYLPFDMSAYKKLNGGSYVRTRVSGGFTGEDMRTLLAGNGRSATVVSGSGVFDIEFDPKMRGGRRFNDKVAKIPEMYERILDEVANGGHYLVDLDAKSLNEVEDQLGRDRGVTADNIGARREHLMDQKRAEMMKITDKDKGLIATRAELLAAQMDNPPAKTDADYDKLLLKARNEIRDERVRELSVNGEGYEVALKTLQRYFPYYVKNVSRRELGEFASTFAPPETKDPRAAKRTVAAANAVSSRGKDKWHVSPGRTTASPRGTKPQLWAGTDRQKDVDADKQTRMVDAGVAKPAPAATAEGAASAAAPGSAATPPWSSVGPQKTVKRGTIAPDPDDNPVVDEAKETMKGKAAKEWWDALTSGVAARIGFSPDEMIQQLANVDSDEFFNDPSSSGAARAMAKALNGRESPRAAEVPSALGASAQLRAKVVDVDGVANLGRGMGLTDQEDFDQLREQLSTMAAKSAFMFGEWAQASEGDSLSQVWNQSGPVMLPEFEGVTDADDLAQFVADDDGKASQLHGISDGVRNAIVGEVLTGEDATVGGASDWMALEALAIASLSFADDWDKAVRNLPADANAQKMSFELARVSRKHTDSDALLNGARVLAKEVGGIEGAEVPEWLASDEGRQAIATVSDAVIAEYSLRARIATLKWGDDPKVPAVSKAAPMIDRSAILVLAREALGLPPR